MTSPRSLADGQIDLWVVRPGELSPDQRTQCAAMLSDAERAQAARFRFERHRDEFVATRALVRTALSCYVDRAPAAWRWSVGPHGRLDPDPHCGVFFNAANHPERVVCAVSRRQELGVDVEPLHRAGEIEEVAETVFTAAELAGLRGLSAPARADRAVALWTLKEAYIKALGLGMSAPLKEISLSFADPAQPALTFPTGFDSPEGWWLGVRELDGFRIAIAVRGAGASPVVCLGEVTQQLGAGAGPLIDFAAEHMKVG